MSEGNVSQVETKHNKQQAGIISTLEGIQEEFGYLPEEALRDLAKESGFSLIDIYSVATFFKAFSLTPRGKHYTTVCMGTACHVRGAQQILEKIERDLDVKVGQTTKDNLFTLEAVNCLGACALGPIVVVDDEYHGNMNVTQTEKLFKKLKKQEEKAKEELKEKEGN
jgi:NADH-quinone oxidoreductase subunit E